MAVYNISYKVVRGGQSNIEYLVGNLFLEANIYSAKQAQEVRNFAEKEVLKNVDKNAVEPLFHVISMNKL